MADPTFAPHPIQSQSVGIGAGIGCDGQILVGYDALGITPGKRVRFTKDFLIETGSVEGAVLFERRSSSASRVSRNGSARSRSRGLK